MFGWEFPPHILGGLGTASYGLTQGMHQCGNMDITFVIPRPHGDEDKSFANIIGTSQVPIAWRDVSRDYVEQRIGRLIDPDLYFRLRNNIYADFNYMRTNDLGCIEFSGRYPDNLLEEINNYSITAGVIARTIDCDIIHSHDSHDHTASHAHFYCEKCARTFCLKDIPVENVALPDGFKANSLSFIIKGECPECSRRK